MQRIPLSQGQFAIVDDEDFPLLADFRWSYHAERNGGQGYAVRNGKVDGKRRLIYMQRELMIPQPGYEVIFLNFDRLDCRRANLKIVKKEETRRYHRARRDSKTGIKGITYNDEFGTWSATIYRNGRAYRIGTFYSKEAAAQAYDEGLRLMNPELFNTNPPARVTPVLPDEVATQVATDQQLSSAQEGQP